MERIRPHMGALNIAGLLREYASTVPEGRTVVELGSWLGAGTYELASATTCEIHVYDKFRASESEVKKAKAFGFDLVVHEDTLPKVRAYLKPFGDRVRFHKGPLYKASYDGPKIGLYVDDASKSFWKQAERIFAPYFDNQTILIMMDYHYPKCSLIRQEMERHEMLLERTPDSSTAVFRWNA